MSFMASPSVVAVYVFLKANLESGGPSRVAATHTLIVKRRFAFAFLVVVGQFSTALEGESVAVRYIEGVVRGFLVLRSLESGAVIANGDLIQFIRGDRVTSRLVFHFRDGSLQEETTVFSQRRQFRLVSDHLVQRGPTFPHPIDLSIDAVRGRITVRHRDEGEEKVIDQQMELPSDLANGMMITLLKNVSRDVPSTTVSMLFATPKPQLVKLVITRMGQEPFSVGRASYQATRFNVKVAIGGLKGVLAKLLGKQPRDTSVWVLGGEAPGFVRSEGQFYQDGPVWRIELASPDYSRSSGAH
jgi:hypothetical protein